MTNQPQWEKISVFTIIVAFSGLALAFSLGPIFEAPDEIEHYRYIRQVQRVTPLPDPAGQPFGQYHQTPLYYWLLQPLAILLPDADFDQIDGRINPNYGYQEAAPGNDNKNLYVHRRVEDFPYQQSETALAVHILRLPSILFGVLTVLLCYRIAYLLWETMPYRRLMAVAIVAFWPKFIYMSSVINNDALAFPLATAALYLLLYQHRHGPSWRRAALLGGVLGAALLVKSSMLMLALPVGIATLLDRRLWKYAVVTLAVTLLISGWWYGRNYLLYGDFTGMQSMFITWEGLAIRNGDIALDVGLQNAPYAYRKVWARFGYGAVAAAPWVYTLFNIIVGVAGVGLVLKTGRHIVQRPRKSLPVYTGIVIVSFALTWVLSMILSASVATAGNQGRYLLPGIASLSVLLTIGIDFWLGWLPISRLRKAGIVGMAVGLFALTTYIVFGHFFPAYRTVPMPETIERPLNIQYDDTAILLGMAPAELTAQPGETISVELYWQALQPASPTLQVYLHTIDGRDLLWRDSLPGNGHRPADDWHPGDQWAERYTTTIPETATPGRYVVVAGLYDPRTGDKFTAYDPAGNDLSNTPLIAYLTITEP